MTESLPEIEFPRFRWSNRILIAAMAGMLFLTCFPFRFVSHPTLPPGRLAFLLGQTMGKPAGALDVFLNVLLFIPIGFGLSEKLLESGKSRRTTFFAVWIGGAVLSYLIEITQLYIPGRDSGWEDVLTNSTGSAVGCLVFLLFGGRLVRLLSRMEFAIEPSLTPGWALLTLLLYFSCWLAISARLQTETRLSNWNPNSEILIGKDPTEQATAAWNGQVSKLEIWNQAISGPAAASVTSGSSFDAPLPEALTTYDFTSGPSARDSSVADLPGSLRTMRGDPAQPVPDPSESVALPAPSNLVRDLQRTNQFAIHLICRPDGGKGSSGEILAIGRPPNVTDLAIGQEDLDLVFWFRTPLFVRRSRLAWHVPNVFQPTESRNILYSYDGSNLFLYVDGKPAPGSPFRVGPGVGLARWFRRIKSSEFDGYHDIYYALVFFPAGAILGLFARNVGHRMVWLFVVLLLLLPPLLFEFLLMAVSGRAFSPESLLLSFGLLAGGALWINADGRQPGRAQPV